MKAFLRLCSILLFIALVSGCKKKITNEHPEFVGSWRTPTDGAGHWVFKINEDGQGNYYQNCISCTAEAEGKVKIKDDILYIRNRSKSKNDDKRWGQWLKFTIAEYPHEVNDSIMSTDEFGNDHWYSYTDRMQLDGSFYYLGLVGI